MARHDMQYIAANTAPPAGVATSTARKGRKWFDLAKTGDVLDLKITESADAIGTATVIKVELVPYSVCIDRASENQVGLGVIPAHTCAGEILAAELKAAYGDGFDAEDYTMVHFIRHNG